MSKSSEEEIKLFNSMAESLMFLSGSYGSRIIGDITSRSSLIVKSISIRTDATTFTTLICTNGTTVYDATFFLGGAAATAAGDLWTAPPGFWFTTIDLASGSIQITGPNITGV